MKYYGITYDGYTLPLFKRLMDEGNEVVVCQVEDQKELECESGLSQEESAESQKRRLSLYDGIIEKLPLDEMLEVMKEEKNKDDCFVIFCFNNLYKIADQVQEMGYTKGMFPTEEDFELEKDRQASKDFVKKHFPDIQVAPTHEFTSVDEAIAFLNENEGIFALKSDGNYCSTVVPLTNDDEFGKQEVIGKLQKHKEDWEKGSFTLEEKIKNPIEVAPQIVFWDGKPIYTEVDIETRMIGGGDVGFQTGGNQNIVMATDFEAKLNKMAFPPIVFEMAKKRRGMYIFDCGLLFDQKGVPFFTEFAGNRWGYGGAFSELSMARKGNRICSEYFEAIVKGENPQKYKFGTTLSLYHIEGDGEFPGLYKQGIPVMWKKEIQRNMYPYQIKLEENEESGEDEIVNVGYANNLFGYVVGYGDSHEEAVMRLYEFADKFSFNGVYYRSKEDWMSKDYRSSIPNRLEFLENLGMFDVEEEKEEEPKKRTFGDALKARKSE